MTNTVQFHVYKLPRGFPGAVSIKELACQCKRPKRYSFNP